MFERADFEAEIDDVNVVDDHYAAILPLRSVTSSILCFEPKKSCCRILALKQQPEKWSAFTSFLSHCQGRRKNAAQWAFLQVVSTIFSDFC